MVALATSAMEWSRSSTADRCRTWHCSAVGLAVSWSRRGCRFWCGRVDSGGGPARSPLPVDGGSRRTGVVGWVRVDRRAAGPGPLGRRRHPVDRRPSQSGGRCDGCPWPPGPADVGDVECAGLSPATVRRLEDDDGGKPRYQVRVHVRNGEPVPGWTRLSTSPLFASVASDPLRVAPLSAIAAASDEPGGSRFQLRG